MASDVPTEFLCPITRSLFQDPVMAVDGHTYERDAILRWFSHNATSPMTGAILSSRDVHANYSIKALVQDFKLDTVLKSAPPIEIMDPPIEIMDPPMKLTCFRPRRGQRFSGTRFYKLTGKQPPPHPQRLHFSIDNSGSMGASSDKKDTSTIERSGFSLLDIATTGLQLAIASAPPDTVISIDSFSSTAKPVFRATKLSAATRALASAAVSNITPEGCTNLWDAIKSAVKSCEGNRYAVVFILTDGIPSDHLLPSRGIFKSFETLVDACCPPQINFLAFGNAPDVKLLRRLAELTKGQVFQIPEAGFIGTCFSNALANVFTRSTASLVVDDEEIDNRLRISDNTSFMLEEECGREVEIRLPSGQVLRADTVPGNTSECLFEFVRLKFVTELSKAMTYADKDDILKSVLICEDFVGLATYSGLTASQPFKGYIEAIIADIKNPDGTDGQVLMALRTHYKTWGEKYILSLVFAHRYKETNNYIDNGTQVYSMGAAGAEAVRIGDLYDQLPPPKASNAKPGVTHTAYTSMSQAGYATHYGGGCFVGAALIAQRVDGKVGVFKRADKVKIGDMVWDPTTRHYETVQGVFKISGDVNRTVCTVGGLEVTPWHPIRRCGTGGVAGPWSFPFDVNRNSKQYTRPVYDFMTTGKSVMASGEIAAVWGHEMTGAVIEHSFFGSRAAILTAFPDCLDRVTHVVGTRFIRGRDGKISGYK